MTKEAQITFTPINTAIKKTCNRLLTPALLLLIASASAHATPIENFGQDLQGLKQAFTERNVHILQLGDSHTAGDYMTEQLRKRLQQEIGDGGLGYAYPMAVRGQRVARHGYDVNGWRLSNSRFDDADYPLGGMVATADSQAGRLTVTSQYYYGDQQDARIIIKGQAGQKIKISDVNGIREVPLLQNGWQTINVPIVFPYTIQADAGTNVGGAWLNRKTGGTVSSMGINGATQSYWQRWHLQLEEDLAESRADLVILAYGTNEAFQNSVSDQKMITKQAIAKIKQGLPNASILVVGAPESLKRTSGTCGIRARSLDEVQSQLRQAAVESGVLYWDWEDSMGGRCSMKSWISRGLGNSDGVHFTRAGYEYVANDLYTNLKVLLNGSEDSDYSKGFSNIPVQKIYSENSTLNDSSSKVIRSIHH